MVLLALHPLCSFSSGCVTSAYANDKVLIAGKCRHAPAMLKNGLWRLDRTTLGKLQWDVHQSGGTEIILPVFGEVGCRSLDLFRSVFQCDGTLEWRGELGRRGGRVVRAGIF